MNESTSCGGKWTFERLFEAWDNLVKYSKDIDEFCPKRDALILESGWEKLEFYKAMDNKELEKYRRLCNGDAPQGT